MADRKDLEFTYSLADRIVRLSLGELADFSGAKYDGDFSLTLEQAQRRKHDYVAEQIGIEPGARVLDLGCGWGPLLNFIRRRGGVGVGVTLSSAQARRHANATGCERPASPRCARGDARDLRPVRRGRQPRRLRALLLGRGLPGRPPGGRSTSGFFANVASVLPSPNGRFYLQTMVFGRNMIPPDRIDVDELLGLPPRDTDAWYLALMGRQFPGSWLPFGREQIERCAEPHFRLVSASNGRLDYIETINQWNQRIGAPGVRKTLFKLQLLPRWLTSPDFRLAFTSGVSANQVCFQRELLDHFRLVFEKPA